MRVSPLIFFEFALLVFGICGSADATRSLDGFREGSSPFSNEMKQSVMRQSTLPGASLGLLCRHRSEQNFTGVDAAFVVCDFRVPLDELSKYM